MRLSSWLPMTLRTNKSMLSTRSERRVDANRLGKMAVRKRIALTARCVAGSNATSVKSK